MTDIYFNLDEVCPVSRDYIYHSTVTTVRCGPCGNLNPNYVTLPAKLPERGRAKPAPESEVIEIMDSPADSKLALQGIPPAHRRALATQIPGIPDFKLGYAEKERQHTDQRIADRKPKTGYIAHIPTIHFSVGVAHFTWDELAEDQGYWNAATNQWSVDEDNRHITSEGLLASILSQACKQTKRANLKKWLYPKALAGTSEWSLGHTNPAKSLPRDIVTWDQPRLLSATIDAGSYKQKIVAGTTRKLVNIWLY
jgi:hypothetical protein